MFRTSAPGGSLAAWSFDRLGQSLQNLIATLNELHALGCGLYLHQQAVDTATPAGKAMFQMMGVFAEFERAMIREQVPGYRHLSHLEAGVGRVSPW